MENNNEEKQVIRANDVSSLNKKTYYQNETDSNKIVKAIMLSIISVIAGILIFADFPFTGNDALSTAIITVFVLGAISAILNLLGIKLPSIILSIVIVLGFFGVFEYFIFDTFRNGGTDTTSMIVFQIFLFIVELVMLISPIKELIKWIKERKSKI